MSVLGEIFDGEQPAAPPVEASATPPAEAAPVVETPAATVPVEKPAEKLGATPAAEAKPKAAVAEASPAAEAVLVEVPKPQIDWEGDENPYKQRHKDASRYANEEHMARLRFEKQLEVLGKKIDGTYDPEKDEPQPQRAEDVLELGQQVGKAQSSLQAAYERDGKALVDKELQEFTNLFEANPVIQARVVGSSQPVAEARRVLKEYRLVQKYKAAGPDELEKAIRKAAIDEELPKLEEQLTQKIMARIKQSENEVKGIGGARNSDARKQEGAFAPTPLSDIF